MKNTLLLSLTFLCFLNVLFTQEGHFTVDFPHQYFQSRSKPSVRFMPLNKASNDTIYFSGKGYTVKYPEELTIAKGLEGQLNDESSFDYQSSKVDGSGEKFSSAPNDGDKIAFGEMSHAGIRNDSLLFSAPIMIVDYDTDEPVFYVDTSATFDFSKALKFTAVDGIIELRLPNHQCVECLGVHRLKRATYTSETDKKEVEFFMTNGYMAKQNELIDADYWYEIQSLNFRYTEFEYDGQVYSLGLEDTYKDGTFNEPKRDLVMIAEGRVDLSEHLSRHGAEYQPGLIIGDRLPGFEVVSIDPSGSSITLKPSTSLATLKSLKINSLVRNLDLVDTLNIYDCFGESLHPTGYTLVDAWGSWCRPCMDAIPEVKAINEYYGDQLKVVGFNVGDQAKKIQQIEQENGMTWDNIIVSRPEAERFSITGYPTYLLFNSEGRLLESGNRLQAIYDYLGEQ